jgi:NCAIR mutase (PurE)-related protein
MTDPEPLENWIRQSLAAGGEPAELLVETLRQISLASGVSADLAATRLDLDRLRRCGHPEVIFAQGKTVDELLAIVARQLEAGQAVLATRVDTAQAEAVLAAHPGILWNRTARTLRQPVSSDNLRPRGRVIVVTAGTSDRPVAEEALETLAFMGVETRLIVDVGVAGPWRLLERVPELRDADAIIVAAGMEAALPSVVGGWVACPVVAVPTSVGYGASFNGLTALLGMLNSCAANVTVVNIDAGFKAGYVAGLIATRAATGGGGQHSG